MIESLNNDRIKEYTKLNQKKYRDDTNMFIIEGTHLVEEAFKNNIVVDAFSLDDKYTKVSEEVMKKLSNLDTPPKYLAVCNKIEEKDINGNVLILDGVQDPGNLGTIIRSSIAFNIDTIILSNDSVDLYNTKVLRATEGMIFNINIIRRDLNEILPNLKDKYTIYTTNVVNGTNLSDIKVKTPFVLDATSSK
jgi:TrmH family RNA methyltransferase